MRAASIFLGGAVLGWPELWLHSLVHVAARPVGVMWPDSKPCGWVSRAQWAPLLGVGSAERYVQHSMVYASSAAPLGHLCVCLALLKPAHAAQGPPRSHR